MEKIKDIVQIQREEKLATGKEGNTQIK